MSGFVTAARYLTIVPVPSRQADGGPEALGRAAGWFPVVGFALGLVLAAADRGLQRAFPPILVALLTLTAWKVLTGGLHLDGLADCLDGLMGRDREERLRIMRDSRIGAFGALGLIFLLLLELTALAELPAGVRWRALLAIPAMSRATAPLLAVLFPPAAGAGQGAIFVGSVRVSGAWIAALGALGISLLALGPVGAAAFCVACVAAGGVGWSLSRQLAGLTGDVIGAAVETAELAVLLFLVAWAQPRVL